MSNNYNKSYQLRCCADTSNQYHSTGLSAKYVAKAGSTLCPEEMLVWANEIFIFGNMHIDCIKEHTGDVYLDKVKNLNIPDKFQLFQRELVLQLLEKIPFRKYLSPVN